MSYKFKVNEITENPNNQNFNNNDDLANVKRFLKYLLKTHNNMNLFIIFNFKLKRKQKNKRINIILINKFSIEKL